MKVEISRHDWSSLRSLWGEDSLVLRSALIELCEAISEDDVDLAVQRIEGETVAPGMISDSSAAAVRCLVYGIYGFTGNILVRVLETLAVIASAGSALAQSQAGGAAERCLKEIFLGFPAFCEILEISQNIDCKSSAIDLILVCGLHDPHLRSAAKFSLHSARSSGELIELGDLIAASLAELDQI